MTSRLPDPASLPDAAGHFGRFGGRYVPETLMAPLVELEKAYRAAMRDKRFTGRLRGLLASYAGRPTPLYLAERLTKHCGGAKIFLKREDLCHTGAHKINNVLGQALLAERMGKRRIIAETGAGQHGVASATAAALFGGVVLVRSLDPLDVVALRFPGDLLVVLVDLRCHVERDTRARIAATTAEYTPERVHAHAGLAPAAELLPQLGPAGFARENDFESGLERAVAEALEVAAWVGEPVGMVDPQPVHARAARASGRPSLVSPARPERDSMRNTIESPSHTSENVATPRSGCHRSSSATPSSPKSPGLTQ